MNLLITGTPGVGKTKVSKELSSLLGLIYINEKDFALKNKIGSFSEDNELEIPLNMLEKKANSFLKNKKNILFEGHVFCETKLKIDFVIVLKVSPEEIESRLEGRNYSPEKIMDNVFCEGIDYCLKHVKKNFSNKQIIVVNSNNNYKITVANCLVELEKRQNFVIKK
ncbi:MAG: AAA family ATPase [Candidatus ainarchaeum sp.]|jgi:adenylate kinase|nr:AAA family ATPase [Candidatus ainarchaeum sp.]MDD3085729.1 AAA family ATPase [Candidatus ainarchaeum sp.]MDD4128547.1 AAA family ATPase [Candidatus ainarchaeum sp.]MDD4467802.1 AAA family ATPase [Candidatus ainarchaeum sp.]HPM85573.1 AAA family ATPase [archaeon]